MSIANIQPRPDERNGRTATHLSSVAIRRSGGSATGPAGSSRAGALLIGAAAALVPWTISLWSRLPAEGAAPTWRLAWVAIDALEAVGLFSSGLLVLRGSARQAVPLALTGTLLLGDAALDVLTSSPTERGWALALLTIEVPVASWCLRLARAEIGRRGVAAAAASR